jgi:hypothetical protein
LPRPDIRVKETLRALRKGSRCTDETPFAASMPETVRGPSSFRGGETSGHDEIEIRSLVFTAGKPRRNIRPII